ncbi:hypothetical protein O181_113022 [Austropuccinia psidii MF-1]|uniref:Uncharacterized protein n=1 Tax=Austropuccinia psidii MF-1 TaxID=1389203 RepID=A0A9Q3PUY0_9BASI|nr:hypothetical protein [Austropuccinia psidii MF-1]
MRQAPLKDVPKYKEWPHFGGEGEYDHMGFIRGIDMIKENFQLPDIFVTARFNTLFTKSAHRCKWANHSWRFKVETAFEYAKFNSDKDKASQCFCQQKHILIALYPDISEFMIHRQILIKFGGYLEHAVKSRTTEQYSEEDIIIILEEVTTRTIIGPSRVNLKTKFNTPWKDSVDRNPK